MLCSWPSVSRVAPASVATNDAFLQWNRPQVTLQVAGAEPGAEPADIAEHRREHDQLRFDSCARRERISVRRKLEVRALELSVMVCNSSTTTRARSAAGAVRQAASLRTSRTSSVTSNWPRSSAATSSAISAAARTTSTPTGRAEREEAVVLVVHECPSRQQEGASATTDRLGQGQLAEHRLSRTRRGADKQVVLLRRPNH